MSSTTMKTGELCGFGEAGRRSRSLRRWWSRVVSSGGCVIGLRRGLLAANKAVGLLQLGLLQLVLGELVSGRSVSMCRAQVPCQGKTERSQPLGRQSEYPRRRARSVVEMTEWE